MLRSGLVLKSDTSDTWRSGAVLLWALHCVKLKLCSLLKRPIEPELVVRYEDGYQPTS